MNEHFNWYSGQEGSHQTWLNRWSHSMGNVWVVQCRWTQLAQSYSLHIKMQKKAAQITVPKLSPDCWGWSSHCELRLDLSRLYTSRRQACEETGWGRQNAQTPGLRLCIWQKSTTSSLRTVASVTQQKYLGHCDRTQAKSANCLRWG